MAARHGAQIGHAGKTVFGFFADP